jgi:NAD(P)-dependent dehydrogenase (short-subunit alcohol dehydrogenase family)
LIDPAIDDLRANALSVRSQVYSKENSLRDKVCIVIGSSSGIGKATATGLASLAPQSSLVVRDLVRGEVAQEEIAQNTGGSKSNLVLENCDLSSMDSIRQFAKR